MAAAATRKPPAGANRPAVTIEQPPRTIVRGGVTVDISHLAGADLYEALISDEEQWDYERIAAECDRTVGRVRVWVSNIGKAARTGRAEDDKTFVEPDGRLGGSPWWYAGNARRVLIQNGDMTREGVAVPYKPTGRAPGARDRTPRRRWAHAPMRDTAADVYREYLELTTRKRNPLSDREARAELCRRHRLTRPQLARRINTGKEQVEGTPAGPVEVDKAALHARLAELVAEYRAKGYSERGAGERARTQLAGEAGMTRRQLAGYTAAATADSTSAGGDG